MQQTSPPKPPLYGKWPDSEAVDRDGDGMIDMFVVKYDEDSEEAARHLEAEFPTEQGAHEFCDLISCPGLTKSNDTVCPAGRGRARTSDFQEKMHQIVKILLFFIFLPQSSD